MSNVLLETRDLTKAFSGFTAVNKVNLRIRSGTIHALIGPNGAGKSTLFNLITKFLEPTSGQIFYDGNDITKVGPALIARNGLVRSFQISAVFPHLTVRENVRIALQQRSGIWFHFWKSESCLAQFNARADELVDLVGLSDHLHRPAVELSYGRRRALEIATTIALDPVMMLLDEPMAGLGREDVSRIMNLIRRVSEGRTVLMVEHNLSVIAELSDTITVLTRGRVLAEGPYSEISRDEKVRAAYLGVGHA